jgi:hypothetical protein
MQPIAPGFHATGSDQATSYKWFGQQHSGLGPRQLGAPRGRRGWHVRKECAAKARNHSRVARRSHLANEIGEGGVQLVVVPVDYAENTRVLVDELRGQVPEIA